MVGGEIEVGREECLESPPHDVVDRARISIPEQPVVDEHEVGAARGRTLEQLERGGDAADELRDLGRPGDLEAHRPVVRVGAELQVLVGERDDLVARGHGATLPRPRRVPCLGLRGVAQPGSAHGSGP